MKLKRLGMLVLALILVLTASGCSGLHQSARVAQNLIALDALIDYPDYTAPQISANGDTILYRDMTSNDEVIAENWRTGEKTVVPWPDVAGIPYFLWAPDGQTVFFFVDNMGDENYGLYTTDIKTGVTKTILTGGDNNCYYVSDIEGQEDEIILALLNYTSESYDLYRVNYKTGDKTLIFENPGDVSNFDFDHTGALRLITITDEQAGTHVLMKKDDVISTGNSPSPETSPSAETSPLPKDDPSFVSSEWEEIFYWDYEDAGSSGVYGFMQDNTRILYVDSSINNTSTLCTYNPETDQIEQIFNDPKYDLYGTWTDIGKDQVTAVATYSQTIKWHILDKSFQDDYDALSAIGPVFEIVGSSADDAYWLVQYVSDTSEPDYYVYDMATHKTQFLFNAQPALLDYDLCEMQPFSYTASDGLEIEGYVTFPVGEKQNLPAVLLVHGGPWARDTWEYNYEVQFLANRGYLVIQANYRGSTGYGRDFMLKGDKEWGRAMHQDILDAAAYAVGQGWADPERIGVYGASYGGYEALICATSSSDVFQCAVDAFGPSSLLTFIESIPTQWSTEYQDLIRSVGDPDTEEEDMKERSPLYHADQVKIPMLIAQGANDPRVPQNESDQMVKALKDAGVKVEYKLYPDSGHGFSSIETRIDFYSEMEEFFARYLGGLTSPD